MARRPASEQFDGQNEISNAAFGLFGRYGYDGVSIDAIAKEAGTSKSALYWHYKNKQALFLDCLNQLQDIFYRTVFEPMTQNPDPGAAMILLFNGALKLLRDERIQNGIAGYWLEAGSIAPKDILLSHQQFNQKISNILQGILLAGQEQKLFEFDQPTDRLATTIILSLIHI